MPPKRKARSSLASVSTPKTPTPLRDEDSMDVDTPQAADTPATPAATNSSHHNNKHNYPPDAEVLGNLWTADQESSLFKAIIRWKPTGMHKHFRMLAISEHLRNHGFDPDVEAHTRIPSIWAKLRTQYDLDIIDDRDNIYRGEPAGIGAGANAVFEELYRDFELPPDDFHDAMFARRLAGPGDPPSSPPEWDGDAPTAPTRKRKRGATTTSITAPDTSSVAGSTATKTRASTVEDTDHETLLPSSPATRTARGARSQKRAAAKAKAESADPELEDSEDGEGEDKEEGAGEDEEEQEEEQEEEEEEEEEEESEPEDAAPPTKASRSATARGRGRGRGRGKRGRK